jgi:hypothetical protein
LEVRLDNRVGNPLMALISGIRIPQPGSPNPGYDRLGYNGGQYYQPVGGVTRLIDDNLITVANPPAGTYNLTVRADTVSGLYPDASADLVVRQLPRLPLNYAASLNGNGLSDTATRQLLDSQKDFFEVAVPTTLGGQPVIGWLIKVNHLQGDTTLRIYKTWGNSGTGITVSNNTALVVPPFLTPGDTWFVEVQGTGLTNYTITSLPITLERPVLTMPAGHNSTFGDSGNDSGGVPLPGDRGVDIGQDDWHFYAIDVPEGNAGLLRTELQAINGNPNLYLREDGVPTTDHNTAGPSGTSLIHRSLTSTASEYGNWVPLDGRYQKQLRAGRWYLGVKASGASNARYRLIVSNGQVVDLSLSGGAVTNQNLVGRDWRYYRFTVPAEAPNTWNLTFSQQVGDVNMWLRDATPPGNSADGLESTDNGVGYTYGLRTWRGDGKNQGPYSSSGQDAAGTYPFTTPPLRPGHTYYVGFRAANDATFSFSSNTSGGTIGVLPVLDYYAGSINTSIPAGGSLLYRIPVPPEATRMKWTATHPTGVQMRLEQGTLPGTTGTQHWTSGTSANVAFNQSLTTANNWPWQSNHDYYLRVMNTSGTAQTVALTMAGKNAATEDEDNDGLPDAWELLYFPSAGSHTGASDPDGDGVTNTVEFTDGTIPNNVNSAKYFLTITPYGGTVGKSPDQLKYDRGSLVNLTNTPVAGHTFLGWQRIGSYAEDFAVKITGNVIIPADGTYTFGTSAADGLRLKVNNVVVISDDTTHSVTDKFGQVVLTAGTYPLELTAFEYNGAEALELFVAAGSHASFNSNFKLLGDTGNGGLVVQTLSGVSTVPGLTVQQLIAVGTGNIQTLARMDELLTGTRAKRAETTIISPWINFLGSGSAEGRFIGNENFPLQQPVPLSPLEMGMFGDYTVAALNTIPLADAVDAPALALTTSGDAPWLGENSALAFDNTDHAGSGPISHSQSSSFSTTVVGPGTLTFRWKVSSEVTNDPLQFLVNGSVNQQISGEQSYPLVTYSVPAGPQTLSWRYTKNSAVNSGSDRGWVDQINFAQTRYTLTVTAPGGTVNVSPLQADYEYGTVLTLTPSTPIGNTFTGWSGALSGSANPALLTMNANKAVTANFTISLGNAVDAPALGWTTGGNVNWTGQAGTTHDSTDAAKSGVPGNNLDSWLETTVTGPGNLSFWWKVSSQSGGDYLRFLVNGAELPAVPGISGEAGWTQISHSLTAGSHTLRWRYVKNASTAAGSDTGWVDEVVWTLGGSAYAIWQAANFTPAQVADPLISGPDADPDKDGLNNLIEFAFGLHPLQASTHLMPAWQRLGNELTCIFNTPAGVSGVVYGAEWSATMEPGSWQPVTDSGTAPQHVFSVPIDGNGKKFVRLMVSAP